MAFGNEDLYKKPFCKTIAAHAEPSWPVTPSGNLMLPQMHGARKEVLAAQWLGITALIQLQLQYFF